MRIIEAIHFNNIKFKILKNFKVPIENTFQSRFENRNF